MQDSNNHTDNNSYSFTYDDLERLKDAAAAISDFPLGYTTDIKEVSQTVQNAIEQAKEVEDVDNLEDIYNCLYCIFLDDLNIPYLLDRIASAFAYWSERNIPIAHVFLDFMEILQRVHNPIKNLERCFRQHVKYIKEIQRRSSEHPLPEYMKHDIPGEIETACDAILKILHAPETSNQCYILGSKLLATSQSMQHFLPDNESKAATTTLGKFLRDYCIQVKPARRISLGKQLRQAHNDRRIKLPIPENEYKNGKPYRYSTEELKNNWPKYRIEMENLPGLK